MKLINYKWSIFILISISAFFLYSFKVINSYGYDSDFARDIYDILQIANGKLMLIGPKSSFGGIFTGPYYYYLFLPIFFLSKFNLNSILIFNSLLFVLSLTYFFNKIHQYNSLLISLFSTISVAILPVYIFAARHPGNAFSYLPFLLILLTRIAFENFESKKTLFLLGLLSGFIVTMHYSNIIVIFALIIYIFILLKKRLNILFFLMAFFLMFTPLFLFEIKHGFIMIKNTFILKSYKTFINDQNLISNIPKKNVIDNFFLLSEMAKKWLLLQPWVFILISLVLLVKNKFPNRELLLFFSSIVSLLILTFALRFQFTDFYLLSSMILIIFTFLFIAIRSKMIFLITIFILLEVYFFPISLYGKAGRQASTFEKAVDYVIANNLIDKNKSFNVIQIRPDTNIAPSGYEYRYFFKKKGFTPNTEFQFDSSQILLIFSEIPKYDIKQLSSWEVEQFGKKNLVNYDSYNIGNISIYKISK